MTTKVENSRSTEDGKSSETTPNLPHADVRKRRGWSIFWLIPIAAAGMAVWLSVREFASSGKEIQIWFKDTYGLQAGNSHLKFRGVNVGVVEKLEVSDDRSYSIITATLDGDYEDLARDGAEFWVVRPQVSNLGVSGLNTIMSQNYIQVRMGSGPEPRTTFVGREQQPETRELAEEPEGLSVTLLAPERWGLKEGAGVYYRGIEIGTLLDLHLETNATLVRFSAFILKPYAPLVRANSRFWKSGGIDVSAGLFSGLDVKVQDLQGLLKGGIGMATPTDAGEPVKQDAVFRLYPEPEPEWSEWRPSIAIEDSDSVPPPPEQEREEPL